MRPGAVKARYPQAEVAYRRWARQPAPGDSPLRRGEVQFLSVGPGVWVANVLAQRGYRGPSNPVPLDYAALQRGLTAVARFAAARGLSIQMPRIGAGPAGGDWGRIAALVEGCLTGHAVTVYDPG
jgi:O-acetyl-ADP-ribose deacetylase (regulator of RNase III)